jgi:outer membrane protein TolC
MAQASAARDAALATADDQRRGVGAQLTQYFAALVSAQSQTAIGETSRAAAAEGLRIVQERYRLGAATIVDVLAAQTALGQAESQLVTAHLNYQIAKAQIEALIGREL